MKWAGVWLIVVSIVHLLVAVALYGDHYQRFAEAGILFSATSDADKLALWFAAAAPMMFAIGRCILDLPKPHVSVGVALGFVAIAGALLSPVSGFWFLLPPAVGIVWRACRTSTALQGS